jgi:hypothetical protein
MSAKKARKHIIDTKATIRRGTRLATRRQFSRPNRLEIVVEAEPVDEGDDGTTKLSISNAYIEDCGGVLGLVGIVIVLFGIVL